MEPRSVTYKLLAPVSTAKLKRYGTLTDLVTETPYLLYFDCVPTLAILNQILKSGRIDHGMSGGAEWKPFEVSQEEYDTLLEELLTLPGRSYCFMRPPDNITEHDQWVRWVLTLPRNKLKDKRGESA